VTTFQLLPPLLDRSTLPGVLQSPTVARHASRAVAATRSRLAGTTSGLLAAVGLVEGVLAAEGVAVLDAGGGVVLSGVVAQGVGLGVRS